MAEWTFITNHAVVLALVSDTQLITARELSLETGITERAIRRIIAELAAENYITKTKEGRRVRYSVNQFICMRHRTQKDTAVGDLLNVLGAPGKAGRA